MHADPAWHAASSQSVWPLQSLSMPSKQFSGPVALQSLGASVGRPLLPPLLAPLLPLLEAPPSENVNSGTLLQATIRTAMATAEIPAVASGKRRTSGNVARYGQQIVVVSVNEMLLMDAGLNVGVQPPGVIVDL